MLLQTTLSLTPCLALFLLACNDTAAHRQAQPQPAPTRLETQKTEAADQTVATPQAAVKPSATILKNAHPVFRHHAVYAHHRTVARPAAPAVAENASPAEPADAAQPSPAVAKLSLPTGTVLTVRLTQELGSKTSTTGDTFSATVSEPVMVDGKPFIPEGSMVSGKVTQATPMGALHQGVLQLTLNSINLNGRDQTIQTSKVSEVEKGKTESAGDLVGNAGAVAVPAAGLAGAGTSATLTQTGLKTEAEAKAGTVVATLTGNKDLVFPAQASMTFTLEQALEIKP